MYHQINFRLRNTEVGYIQHFGSDLAKPSQDSIKYSKNIKLEEKSLWCVLCFSAAEVGLSGGVSSVKSPGSFYMFSD